MALVGGWLISHDRGEITPLIGGEISPQLPINLRPFIGAYGDFLGCATLPETNSKSTWTWMFGIRLFPSGAFRPIFRCKLAVGFRECRSIPKCNRGVISPQVPIHFRPFIGVMMVFSRWVFQKSTRFQCEINPYIFPTIGRESNWAMKKTWLFRVYRGVYYPNI